MVGRSCGAGLLQCNTAASNPLSRFAVAKRERCRNHECTVLTSADSVAVTVCWIDSSTNGFLSN